MKKFITGLLLATSLIFTAPNEVTAQTVNYARIDVFNGAGVNASDFIFSYDSNDQCDNNIKIKNNLGFATNFNFRITINNGWVYTGYVQIPAYGNVYFNDAFQHCSSSNGTIRIRCW